MDYFLSSSLQGTWRDAAVKDVTKMFGPACGRKLVRLSPWSSSSSWRFSPVSARFLALLRHYHEPVLSNFC